MHTSEEFHRQDFGSGRAARVAWWIFHRRRALLALFIVLTVILGGLATRLRVEAGFNKTIPLDHEYMRTFLEYGETFGGANQILVALRRKQGDIYQAEFLETLRKVHEDVFYIPGVRRPSVTSIWSPNVRFMEVVEDGFRGGALIGADFDGSPAKVDAVREKVLKSEWVGRIVANDFRSALVAATLMDADPRTGQALDLGSVARRLEELRSRYANDDIDVHIIGFAKAVGDIAEGARGVLGFFAIAFAVTALLLYGYSRSLMLTGWALICAIVPVVWLLGLMPLLGLGLDPMSILLPFLIFAIGVSHAVQMTNAWKLEAMKGADGITASRNAFMKLFVPGAMALLANALGFLVIAFVRIEIVRELALAATLGVTVMIVTNKLLLPILLSYMTFPSGTAHQPSGLEVAGDRLWGRLAPLATRRHACVALAGGCALAVMGLWQARDLKIGDLGKGVPELRQDSRYNRDVEAITDGFSIGVDRLSVIAEAKGQESPCLDPAVMDAVDRFEFSMRQLDGVQSVWGLAGFAKNVNAAYSEANLKWRVLPESRAQLAQAVAMGTRGGGELMNQGCTAMQISHFTTDHQATTLARIVERIKELKRELDSERLTFRLAGGNAGVMAATNEAVEAADKWVNFALFASVGVLCLATFRSFRVTLCIILPLALVTLLCNALMAALGIGVKVNTLPVVALGVGVGVDYGIYLFERMKHEMHERNLPLPEAFRAALEQRGSASAFTAATMTVSVATWSFSSLKFQADMGMLLAFMFLVNMIAALLLLPALAAFLVGDRLRPHSERTAAALR